VSHHERLGHTESCPELLKEVCLLANAVRVRVRFVGRPEAEVIERHDVVARAEVFGHPLPVMGRSGVAMEEGDGGAPAGAPDEQLCVSLAGLDR
jgi:hypothetical protein